MMCKVLGYTILAWLVGLFIDSNINFISPNGYLMLRIILPMLVMGGFVLAGNDK